MSIRPVIRQNPDSHAAHVANTWGPWVPKYFEFFKRAAIVAGLKFAGQHSLLLQGLYWVSLAVLVMPVIWWAEQHEVGFRGDKRLEPKQIILLMRIARVVRWLLVATAYIGGNFIATTIVGALTPHGG